VHSRLYAQNPLHTISRRVVHGLGCVGSGSRIFVFSGLGWVMGLKWQICEKHMSCTLLHYVCNFALESNVSAFWKFAVWRITASSLYGRGWVWVGLGQLFGELGWVGLVR